MTDVDSVFGVFPRFPNPDLIRRTRIEALDEGRVFDGLVMEARKVIARWSDPEVEPFAKVTTRNIGAAERLIDALRAEGYAADFHWHGDNERFVVQFALEQTRLNFAHVSRRR